MVPTEEYKKYLKKIKSNKTVHFKLLMTQSDVDSIPQDSLQNTEQAMKIMLLRFGYNLVPQSDDQNVIEIFMSIYPCGEYPSQGSGVCFKSTLSLFDKNQGIIFKIYSDSGPLLDKAQYKTAFYSNSDKTSMSNFKQATYNISKDKLLQLIKKELKQIKK